MFLQKNNLSSKICCAGGWVRDKLLNKESDDIDISLSDIKGSKKSKLINEEFYPGEDKVQMLKKVSIWKLQQLKYITFG